MRVNWFDLPIYYLLQIKITIWLQIHSKHITLKGIKGTEVVLKALKRY